MTDVHRTLRPRTEKIISGKVRRVVSSSSSSDSSSSDSPSGSDRKSSAQEPAQTRSRKKEPDLKKRKSEAKSSSQPSQSQESQELSRRKRRKKTKQVAEQESQSSSSSSDDSYTDRCPPSKPTALPPLRDRYSLSKRRPFLRTTSSVTQLELHRGVRVPPYSGNLKKRKMKPNVSQDDDEPPVLKRSRKSSQDSSENEPEEPGKRSPAKSSKKTDQAADSGYESSSSSSSSSSSNSSQDSGGQQAQPQTMFLNQAPIVNEFDSHYQQIQKERLQQEKRAEIQRRIALYDRNCYNLKRKVMHKLEKFYRLRRLERYIGLSFEDRPRILDGQQDRGEIKAPKFDPEEKLPDVSTSASDGDTVPSPSGPPIYREENGHVKLFDDPERHLKAWLPRWEGDHREPSVRQMDANRMLGSSMFHSSSNFLYEQQLAIQRSLGHPSHF